MKVIATDFGAARITRLYCDACSSLCIVCYKGKNGDYCSQKCLDSHDDGKVKTPEYSKVKIAVPAKVKIRQKVKTAPNTKIKTDHAPARPRKVKISNRERKGKQRRAAIKRIRNEMIAASGREPTIAEVQNHLTPLGLNASVRTVWIDLVHCQAQF